MLSLQDLQLYENFGLFFLVTSIIISFLLVRIIILIRSKHKGISCCIPYKNNNLIYIKLIYGIFLIAILFRFFLVLSYFGDFGVSQSFNLMLIVLYRLFLLFAIYFLYFFSFRNEHTMAKYLIGVLILIFFILNYFDFVRFYLTLALLSLFSSLNFNLNCKCNKSVVFSNGLLFFSFLITSLSLLFNPLFIIGECLLLISNIYLYYKTAKTLN